MSPEVQFIFDEIARRGLSKSRVGEDAGFSRNTLYSWKTHGAPLFGVKAVLNYLGYDLKIVPLPKV
jgi:DNA-binding phage protein